jgi:hypothetical protein
MVSEPFTCVEPLLILCIEIAGTSGAFASSSAISRWGNNYSFFLTPIFFAIAGLIWIFISVLNFDYNVGADEELEQAGLSNVERSKQPSTNYLVLVFRGFLNFGESIWVGAKLIFTNRCFICESPKFLSYAGVSDQVDTSRAPTRLLDCPLSSPILGELPRTRIRQESVGNLRLESNHCRWLKLRGGTPVLLH